MSSVRAAGYVTVRGHVLGPLSPAVVAPHLPPAQVVAAVVGVGARPSLHQAPFVLPTKKKLQTIVAVGSQGCLSSLDCNCGFSATHPFSKPLAFGSPPPSPPPPKRSHLMAMTAVEAGAEALVLQAEQPKRVELRGYVFGSIASFQHSGGECGRQASKASGE